MLRIFILCFLSLFSMTSVATEQHEDPYEMVQRVADLTFKRVAKDKAIISENKEHYRVIVEEELVPYIDYIYAAKLIIGPSYNSTTKEQRIEFIKAFKSYLILTYANVFTFYKEQKVIFEPVRPINGNQKTVTVTTRIIDDGKPDIEIKFKVRRRKDGSWKAYDMIAEGISLLDSKRAELGGLIRRQGIEEVTQMLIAKSKDTVTIKSEQELKDSLE